jgi:carboxyl-terminal processing protease
MEKRKGYPRLKWVVYVLIVIAGLFSFAFVDDLFLISKNLDTFASIYKEINLSYVDEVNTSKLMKTGIDAMLAELDPYTQYVPESEMEDFKLKFVSSEYDGIGVKIGARNGKVFISEIFENFPAQQAGMQVGDEILEINHVGLKEKSPDQASLMLKGPQNTPLDLLISRVGHSKPIEVHLVRVDIKQSSVPYYGLLAEHIGYIKLDRFQVNAAQDVTNGLLDLRKHKLNGLVLDLRDNGGGMVAEAIKLVNVFVNRGIKVAVQKGRHQDQITVYQTTAEPVDMHLPLVVLMNSNSASASEIVAGALQDLDRAVIIGQRSFGKGLVQQTINMPYNSLLKITIAKYYTPSGRCIQALDYAHREASGDATKVADSLMREYKTKAGRSVYDGNGIYPDIFIKPMDYHAITKVLINKDYIFDYATKFRSEVGKIGEAKNFRLSDADYEKFVLYLSTKDYSYDTPTELALSELIDEAMKEGTASQIKAELEALRVKVYHSKKSDLSQFQDEVRAVLENEIVSRYYFERGRFEQSFQYDKEVQEALKVVTNKATMTTILGGVGTYKIIGKPDGNFSDNN